MTEEQIRRVKVAALYVRNWLRSARDLWDQTDMDAEERAYFLDFFDSQERTFLANRANGTTKPARNEL